MPTLEELELDVWPEPEVDTYLVSKCHRLRKKPIDDYSIEDFRIMINQSLGLPYLLPKALDCLDANPLAEGDMYPGDLISAITSVDRSFYADHAVLLRRAIKVAREATDLLHGDNEVLANQLQAFIVEWSR